MQNLNSTCTRISAPPLPSCSHLRSCASTPAHRTGGTREHRAQREKAEGRGQCQEGPLRTLKAAMGCAQGHPAPPAANPGHTGVPRPQHGAARPPRHHVRPARPRSHSPSSLRPPCCCLEGGRAVPGTQGDGGERSEPHSSARSGPRAPGPAPLTADAPPRWPGRQKGASSQQAPQEAPGNSRESRAHPALRLPMRRNHGRARGGAGPCPM